jgi:holo-[acyl-carrier protein] synthase
MDQASEFRSIVAEFLEVDVATVDSNTELGGPNLSTSLARAGLDAALRRRLGLKCPLVYRARRYGELERAALGGTATSDDSSEQPGTITRALPDSTAASAARTLACGVDIEEVDALPNASDYWEHEFYRATFADSEIAYCSIQQRPREHFAARWAAKEALRKLGAEYLNVDSSDLAVVLREDGAPEMTLRGKPLPVALSLSHTGSTAVAIAVKAATTNEKQANASIDEKTTQERPPKNARRDSTPRLMNLLKAGVVVLALGIAVWALVRTLG